MPPAVLPQHKLAFGHADRLRFHDLVSGPFLQIAILMDASFMREGIPPDDGFVRLGTKTDDGAEGLAGGEQVFGGNASRVRITVVSRLHHHYDLFERAVSRTLTDAISGALDLALTGLDGIEGVRNG